MGKEILQQLVDTRKTIKDIERKIARERSRPCKSCNAVVTGSSNVFPYIERRFYVDGVSVEDTTGKNRRIERMEKDLEYYYDKYLEQKLQAFEYTTTVPESRIRLIMRYRYIDGMNWKQVAREMGHKYTADNCRAILKKYMNED
jgi:hypothetical protein